MADFNWCHGPECHKKHTVDRVRGVKGSKVLRTRKIKQCLGRNIGILIFVVNDCYNDFANTYIQQIISHCTEDRGS